MVGSRIPGAGRPLRLVFLLEELHFGGTQRQTLELARRLDRRQFASEVWLLRAGAGLAPLARQWQVPQLWLAATPAVGLRSLTALWRRLRQADIHILVLLTAIPNIWGRLLGRVARVPCIIGNVRSQTAQRQHERLLWPLAHHLICNNQALLENLAAAYRIPRQRLSLIYNGVDTEFFCPAHRPPPDRPPVILSIGRLVPDKAQEILIQAFARLLPHHPTAQLWLVGDGPRRPDLAKLLAATLPGGQATLFPGQIDLRPFYQQATCFALSSRTEALPNVVLEAMAAGLPVVATRVGGVPEAVAAGQTGWLVPPNDPDALGQALSRLLGDEQQRRQFGLAGRQRVLQEFSLSQMVQRYEAVFEHVWRRNATGRAFV